MTRYLSVALLAAALAASVISFAYRTEAPPAEPAAQATFGGVSLNLELATTTAARERGLGGKTALPEDYGMLFVFPKDERHGFWMKSMLLPIDIFWLDAQGQVVALSESVATSSYPTVFYPSEPARYVLETAAGFARAHGVATGTPLLLKNFPTVSK